MSVTPALPRSVERPTIVHHLVLVSLLVITSINYIQRNAINPAATTISHDLALSLSEVGLIMGAFFLSYTIMMLPSGLLAQFMGAKWALVLFAAGWSVAIALTALANNFLSLYAGRIAMGALQAGIFPCATLILQAWYPASRRGLATSLLNSFMLIGGVLGSVTTGALLQPLGWRGVFLVYAVPGLVWAAWFAWWFRGRPQDHPGVNEAELEVIRDGKLPPAAAVEVAAKSPAVPASEQIKAHHEAVGERPAPAALSPAAPTAIHNKGRTLLAFAILTLVLLYTQQAFRAGANRLFDTWMPAYYELEQGTSKQVAAYLSGFLQAMGVVGGLAGGLLSDEVLRRTKSLRAARNGVALFSLCASVVFYVASYYVPNVYLASAVCGLGVFVFCFSSPCAYALTMDVGGKYLAVIFSLMNTVGNLGAFAFVSFAPRLVEWGGWNLLLIVFIGMHLIAAGCWLLLDPTATIDDAFAGGGGEK